MPDNSRGTVDFLSRVSVSNEDADEATVLREERNLRKPLTRAEGERGRSMLSPENENNKPHKQDDDDYISPFSDEYMKKSERIKEEYEDEVEAETAISSNRIQAYAIFAGVLYIIILCIGYHYTTFEDNVPQVVTVEQLDANEYLAQANEYVLNIQALHEESVEAIERFTGGTMGASELSSLMKKSSEKLLGQQEELKEFSVPEGYESFQSTLLEMYSLQASMNAAAVNYAAERTEASFEVVNNINTEYDRAADDFMFDFNNAFK